jgi:hypothetical protein
MKMLRRFLWVPIAGIFVTGCVHERVVKNAAMVTYEGVPQWALQPPLPAQGKVFFTGRSLAVNALDKRSGMNEAVNDAIYQIARAAGSQVNATIVAVDTRIGEDIRGKEEIDRQASSVIRIDVDGVVVGIQQEDAFWEQFSIRERILGPRFVRVRYQVLVSIPEGELERLREEVKKKPSPL